MVGHAGLGFHSRFTLTNAFRIDTCSMWMYCRGCIIVIREHRRCAFRKRCFANHPKQLPPVPPCALSLDQTHHRRPGDMRVRGVHTPAAQRLGQLRALRTAAQRTAYTNPVWYGTRTHRPMTRSQEPVLECDTAQLDSRQHHAHASCLSLASRLHSPIEASISTGSPIGRLRSSI